MNTAVADKPAPVAAPIDYSKLRANQGLIWPEVENHHCVWGYETEHPWPALMQDTYFLGMWHWFVKDRRKMDWRPDVIRVHRPIRYDRVYYWERCEFVVTFASNERVSVRMIGRPVVIGAPEGTRPSYPDDQAQSARPK